MSEAVASARARRPRRSRLAARPRLDHAIPGASRASWCWSPGSTSSGRSCRCSSRSSSRSTPAARSRSGRASRTAGTWAIPVDSVWHDPTLQRALIQSLKLAGAGHADRDPDRRGAGAGPGPLARPRLGRLQLPDAVPAGDARDRDGRLAASGVHSALHLHPPRHDWPRCSGHVTFSISYVVVIVRGRLFSIGRSVRGGGRRSRRHRRGSAAPGAAAAAAAGDLRQPDDRVRDLDRRLRDQPVAVLRRQLRRRCRCASTARPAPRRCPRANALARRSWSIHADRGRGRRIWCSGCSPAARAAAARRSTTSQDSGCDGRRLGINRVPLATHLERSWRGGGEVKLVESRQALRRRARPWTASTCRCPAASSSRCWAPRAAARRRPCA